MHIPSTGSSQSDGQHIRLTAKTTTSLRKTNQRNKRATKTKTGHKPMGPRAEESLVRYVVTQSHSERCHLLPAWLDKSDNRLERMKKREEECLLEREERILAKSIGEKAYKKLEKM
jgi:hypothetical protein